MNRLLITNQSVCFWAYLAGLFEADGHYATEGKLVISAHKSQLYQLYGIAYKVNKPFSINVRGNTARLVWTNPLAINYILGRFLGLLNFNKKVLAPLLPKLSEAEKSLTSTLEKRTQLNKKTKTAYNVFVSLIKTPI